MEHSCLNRTFVCLFALGFCFMPVILFAQTSKVIQLPAPQTEGGRPLMEVLKDRKSTRQYSDKEIPEQVLSNLLWAAFGVNRPELGKRTAPSAVNWQEIDIYVAMETGCYLYNAIENVLRPILMEDIRPYTGTQAFVKDAPVNLVFVADYSRMGNTTIEQKDFYSAADCGFISQNVYLFCASEGLGTVVRGLVDRDVLSKKMDLREDQKIILAQTIGYPQE